MKLFKLSEEHKMLCESVKAFTAREVEPQALEQDQKEQFNLKLFKKLGPLGLLGLTADPQYGGSGMDAVSVIIVHEELSYSDPGFCLAYLAHAVLCVHNISINAGSEQKKRWLPLLCTGERVGAMAMSEAEAGTDVLGMKSSFTKTKDHFVLNGRKMWITNGAVDENNTPADCVLVYAQSGQKSISSFIVEKGFKGYEAGQKIRGKTGMRSSNTAELVFKDCEIPFDNMIGKEGCSIENMMRNLEIERLALAGMGLGIARRCLREMNRYASERKAFGKSIREFGQIQKYLSECYAEYSACRSYIYNIADNISLKSSGHRLDCDSAKWLSAQMAKKTADRAIQVLGGYGYVGEYHVERLWRDAKLLEIGGGTNEALEKNITSDLKNISF